LRALDLLATRATTPKLRPVITQIRDRVREGKSLSEAIDEAGVFSKVYSTAILAGERAETCPGCWNITLRTRSEHRGKEEDRRDAGVSGAVDYRGHRYRDVPGDCGGAEICGLVSRSGSGVADITRVLMALTVDYRCGAGNDSGDSGDGAGSVFVVAHGRRRAAFDRFKFKLPIVGDTMLKFQVAQFRARWRRCLPAARLW